jgi:hypothetical protein
MNSRSIAGVSQRTESRSASDDAEAAAPFIRTCRRSGAFAATPVPMSSCSPSRAATPKPPAPPLRTISESAAPRSPRPGASRLTASSMFVFPAPFSPVRITSPGPGATTAST